MTLTCLTDPLLFQKLASPLFLANEAKYCVPIGIVETLVKNPKAFASYFFWNSTREASPIGAAWLTPPFPVGLSDLEDAELEDLIADILAKKILLSGAVGPENTVERFASFWTKCQPCRLVELMRQGIYQASAAHCPYPVKGSMRFAKDADIHLLAQWNYNFEVDCRLPTDKDSSLRQAKLGIEHQNRVLWEVEGTVVSMAAFTGRTPTGIRITWVYTPPEHRGHGYASALVAQISQQLIDDGRKVCFLYTDLSNPTSNSIYQKVGYQHVCDSAYAQFAYD